MKICTLFMTGKWEANLTMEFSTTYLCVCARILISISDFFRLTPRMNEYDKQYFPCDVRKFQWDSYCYNYNLGLIRYIGNETLDDFEPARRRMRRFYIAHFFVLVIYYSLLAIFYFYLGRLFGINGLIASLIDRIGFSFNWQNQCTRIFLQTNAN